MMGTKKNNTPQNRTETSVGRKATTAPTWTEGHKDSSYQSCRATQVRTIKSSWDNETQVNKIKQEVNHRKKNTRRQHYQNKTGNTQTEDNSNYFQNVLQWRFCPTAAQSHIHSTVHIYSHGVVNIKGPVWGSGDDRAPLALRSMNLILVLPFVRLPVVSPAAFNTLLYLTGRKRRNHLFILEDFQTVPKPLAVAAAASTLMQLDCEERRHQFCF